MARPLCETREATHRPSPKARIATTGDVGGFTAVAARIFQADLPQVEGIEVATPVRLEA